MYLFHCDAEWSIERVQVWNGPRGPKLESTDVIRSHAETLYAGSAARWVKVDDLRLVSSSWPQEQRLFRALVAPWVLSKDTPPAANLVPS